MRVLMWHLLGRKRKQCCGCKKTFYKPFRGTVTHNLMIAGKILKVPSENRFGCPHCFNGDFIRV